MKFDLCLPQAFKGGKLSLWHSDRDKDGKRDKDDQGRYALKFDLVHNEKASRHCGEGSMLQVILEPNDVEEESSSDESDEVEMVTTIVEPE